MNISKNIGYKDYLTYTDSQKYNILIKREEEIERLNNIINELEKDIENKITFCSNEANGSINNNLCKISIQYLKHLKDKIKELKGERINETRHNN